MTNDPMTKTMENLTITVLQAYLFWEQVDKNLQHIEEQLTGIQGKTDLIILPEMFSTGFSMNAAQLAEPMDGKTMAWMAKIASQHQCVITGSIIIKENERYYNRLIWMKPDGNYDQYDKRHLFALGKEHETYSPGNKKLIVELKGWKISLAICYDLRFPVWLRNVKNGYDLLLIVANWPERRIAHWSSLISARAIENQAFVIGVNRVGHDGNEIYHNGASTCVDPFGNIIYYKTDKEDLNTITLPADDLKKARTTLPFLQDADQFEIVL